MIWIAWPKKASGVATELNENIVREIGLAKGLVDVKVCAIDDIWSGLKLVIRKENRRGDGLGSRPRASGEVKKVWSSNSWQFIYREPQKKSSSHSTI